MQAIPLYEYVLRFGDRDEIRLTDHDGHEVGDEVTVEGETWVVESISFSPVYANQERVVLRPAARGPSALAEARSG